MGKLRWSVVWPILAQFSSFSFRSPDVKFGLIFRPRRVAIFEIGGGYRAKERKGKPIEVKAKSKHCNWNFYFSLSSLRDLKNRLRVRMPLFLNLPFPLKTCFECSRGKFSGLPSPVVSLQVYTHRKVCDRKHLLSPRQKIAHFLSSQKLYFCS